MENVFNRFVLRTPLLPFDVLRTITGKEQLLAYFQQPLMQEAIYLASPELYYELQKNKPDQKLVFSLMKYLQRAATRCTPFAFFASCAVIESGPTLAPADFVFSDKRHTRPDMNYLCALAHHIANDPDVREKLTYYPNTGLYASGDKIRYTEYSFSGTMRRHQLTNVDRGGYIERILQVAASGKTIDELVPVITDEEVSEAEAREFINQVIDAQLLVSNLDPPVTGEPFLNQLIRELDNTGQLPARKYGDVLRQLQTDLQAADEQPMGSTISRYPEIGKYLEPLGVAFDPKFLFQADAFRETNFTAPGHLATDLHEGLVLLARLSGGEMPNLNAFRDAFVSRYDGREVPLTEVLDTENGLSYPYSDSRGHDPAPLIDGITPGKAEEPYLTLRWTPTHDLLFKKITGALAEGSNEIVLTEADVQDFRHPAMPLADTYSALCSVIRYNRQSGTMQLFLNIAGNSSAVNLLGRFCHGDKKIEHLCREICAHEAAENPDVLLAEIVHLPESRLGNVLFRPLLRNYEIPYLAKSAALPDNQLPLGDLMLSVRNNKLVLCSAKYNRMVVPRLGNSHNYSSQGLPIYHFLCDLQHEYARTALGFDLDFFTRRFSFVPRITYKNIVFTAASWQFKKSDVEYLFALQGEALQVAVTDWRTRNNLPQYQLLPDFDNELFIDWSNLLSVQTLFDVIRKRDNFRLTEFLFDPEEPLLRNNDGFFTNQFIISYKNNVKRPLLTEQVAFVPQTDDSEKRRDFEPGSEWLYFKIYTGIKSADRILTEQLLPFAEQAKAEGLIDTCFFIRYGDPRDHIRFRMRCMTDVNRTDLLKRFHEAIAAPIANGFIAQVQLDTYQRELERYGHDTIELAEQLFDTDSMAVLHIISYLDGDYGDTLRWKIGLLVIDIYFRVFRMDREAVIAFTANQVAFFETEYHFGKDQRIQVDKSYREKRSAVEYVLGGSYTPDDECMPLYELVNAFGKQLSYRAAAIHEKAGTERTMAYLSSFIHMSVNRLFRSRQRFHELVIYTFLNKYHSSALARQKKAALTGKKAHV